MLKVLRDVLKVLRDVLKKPGYLLLAFIVSFLIFSFAVWLRNFPLLGTILTSPAFSIPNKVILFVKFLGGIATNVTPFSASLIIAMSVLFGLNAALFAYYLVQQRQLPRKGGAGAIGALISGMFGVGCASCGSFVLGSILASFGASGLIVLLPLRGEELSILSIILLALSIYWMSKSIQSTKICAV